jgi:hypothetical protein
MVHRVNEYASKLRMVAGLTVEAVFSEWLLEGLRDFMLLWDGGPRGTDVPKGRR